ncbi:beta-lactamase family protein [Aquimarina sp. ERC-38]|uniref:serine hydrolase domain-containing protein n=1 Tax=Aquimarina sp. ERC-38 TaxID=2949996 RepID=UPI0022459403|nr:serine hydrolase domain-containing protein [Aquimarina sp. ERC-38]UZO81252.1 beta-lactamase family protein [Aquimarina sp. ERC-38]
MKWICHLLFLTGMIASCSTVEPKENTIQIGISDSIQKPKVDSLQLFVDHYDKFFTTSFNISECPGAAVVIVKDSTVIYKKGFGVKKLKSTDSVDVHTVFRIASLSKGVTAVLAGNLVDNGLLTWDQNIRELVPSFTLKNMEQANRLTATHLLSHSSGLYKYTNTKLIHKGLALDNIIAGFRYANTVAEEGTTYAYQNAVFSIMEKVMEAKTEITFRQLLQKRLFDPLGMKTASASYESIIANPNVALPHKLNRYTNKYTLTTIHPNYYNVVAAGGINASITDMGEYLKALLGYRPDIISKESLNVIFTPEVETKGNSSYVNLWEGVTKSYYAKGWRILDYHGRKIVYHGGNVNQYKGQLMVDPENNIAICILFNGANQFNGPVIPTFLNYYDFYRDLTSRR